jgi:hypothetical protein
LRVYGEGMVDPTGDDANPLIHPEVDPPGSKNMDASELHPNAVHQDYNLAGGKREKGEAYEPDFKPAKPDTPKATQQGGS